MNAGQQGLLGGVVYLSLSLGGPFAGYLLRNYTHKLVLIVAVAINLLLTLFWALTPVNESYSTTMFITIRFFMGFTQCVVCVFLPLWTNENAPRLQRTSWMSYLQVCYILWIIFYYFTYILIEFEGICSIWSYGRLYISFLSIDIDR